MPRLPLLFSVNLSVILLTIILLSICIVFLCFLSVSASALLLTIVLFNICLVFLSFLCQFSAFSFHLPLLVLPPSCSSPSACLSVSSLFFSFCSMNIVLLWYLFAVFSPLPHSVIPASFHPSCLPATIIHIKLIKKYSPICFSATLSPLSVYLLCGIFFFFSVCPPSLFILSISFPSRLLYVYLPPSKLFYLQDPSHSSTEAA